MARTPTHPGEHLAEELKHLGISAAELARQIDVPVNRITEIMNGRRGVTADTALRSVTGLAPARNIGSTCKNSMSCDSRGGRWATSLRSFRACQAEGRCPLKLLR